MNELTASLQRTQRVLLTSTFLAVSILGTAHASVLPYTPDPTARVSEHGNTTSGRIEPPYDPGDNYISSAGRNGFVYVNPDALNSLFMTTLKTAFPESGGWSYAIAATGISAADFLLHTYDAEHGRNADGACPTCVGAEFDLEYKPSGTDPTDNVHWIQIVADNHGSAHGVLENVVDNPFSTGHRSPYYDDGGAASNRNFYDFPFRSDDDNNHFWTANLLLVTGPAADAGPGKITVYNDVVWGWGNSVPEPSTYAMMSSALLGLVWMRLRRSRMILPRQRRASA
jgi:hypothetical protein